MSTTKETYLIVRVRKKIGEYQNGIAEVTTGCFEVIGEPFEDDHTAVLEKERMTTRTDKFIVIPQRTLF
jgi:hypothetical protein